MKMAILPTEKESIPLEKRQSVLDAVILSLNGLPAFLVRGAANSASIAGNV
jgi:hypothetical protein